MNDKSNTGTDVFTAIEGFSSVGQVTAYRAIANSAICSAVFAANALLETDYAEDPDAFERLRTLMASKTELYCVARSFCMTLATTKFDEPMTLDDAVEFASTTASRRENSELPDEILEQLGLTRAQLRLIDSAEQAKQQARDKLLREKLRANASGIVAEVQSYLTEDERALDEDAVNEVIDQLSLQAHHALFQKVSLKLSGQMSRVLGIRDRYEGALGDAMMLSGDIKLLDKAFKVFLRDNAGELRDVA